MVNYHQGLNPDDCGLTPEEDFKNLLKQILKTRGLPDDFRALVTHIQGQEFSLAMGALQAGINRLDARYAKLLPRAK